MQNLKLKIKQRSAVTSAQEIKSIIVSVINAKNMFVKNTQILIVINAKRLTITK
jgi:hypothetical protein